MRLLQLDSLMTCYTDARPEDGLFVPLPSLSRQLDAVGDNGQLIQSSPRTRRALSPVGGCPSGVLQPDSIINGMPKLLLAPEVALCGLNRCVTEKELDLLQFAAGEMA